MEGALGRMSQACRMTVARYLLQIFVFLVVLSVSCQASLQRSPSEFARTIWHVQEGLPENTVQAMQQTAAGYLWIGTTGGAVRFDGSHFSPVANAEGSIFSMLAEKDGSLWLGTEGSGLLHLQPDGTITTLFTAQGLTDGFVRAILRDRRGRIWVGTDNGLFWIEGDHARQVRHLPSCRSSQRARAYARCLRKHLGWRLHAARLPGGRRPYTRRAGRRELLAPRCLQREPR